MASIFITIEKEESESDVRLIDLWQTPVMALKPFWNGNDESLNDFLKKYHLEWEETHSIYETKMQSAEMIEKCSDIFKQDIAQFDFRLASALKGKGLAPFADVPLVKISFDIKSYGYEEQEILKNYFFTCTSRSFLDFRGIQDSKLIFYYSRRGLIDEESKIGVYTTRVAYNFKENTKNIKDTNFILSGLCLGFAYVLPNITFCYSWKNGIGLERETHVTGQEILISKQESIRIRNQAKEELKSQKMKNRTSLAPESLEQKLSQAATTQFRMNLEDSFEECLKLGVTYYAEKEREKLEMRLQKAEQDAKEAYIYIRTQIDDGISIKEALDLAKQKYRDDDTINLASLLITRDIQDISKKETQISSLKEEITNRETEYQKSFEQIAKLEQTISSLKGSLSEKVNELNLFKEKAEEEMKKFAEETEKNFKEAIEKLVQENEQLETDLAGSGTVIDRLHVENSILKDNNAKAESKNEELQKEIRELYIFKAMYNQSSNSSESKEGESVSEIFSDEIQRISELPPLKKCGLPN
ncbi:hypothetical protein CCZ01_09125 [Helicobacter monodelphidis]|uniref:hypothetical protein n=1 Tax=Helicobacter sp. 15-1451 TaxID=2004995 RepID=UPI000DCD8B8E|nr:hypothetical protein [Helicobacter sp. 15-1451]RAX56558.1 hypothetical protein CCZ01_09125 [Helicobacter sp. 15-1451]